MRERLNRRSFLGWAGLAATGIGSLASSGAYAAADKGKKKAMGAARAEKIGWRLGCQAYSFNRFTFYEAIEKTRSLGLHYIEMYPKQKLSAESPDVLTNETMSAQVRQEVKKRLADSGVQLVNYGVCPLTDNETQSRATFEFAKDMGIETLVSEPPIEAFDLLEKLADEFAINVAIHNHPKPSPYWDYKTVLKVCEGRSKRIGACADTGHWMRSGIDPVEAIKALSGRIISFHLKDLNGFGVREAHDVPWGTGKADLDAITAEIYRQGFKGVFSIEYEHNWLESLPEIAASVRYFNRRAGQLAGKKA